MSCQEFRDRIVDCCTELARKTEARPEYTNIGKEHRVRLDADITVFDNADTQKKGAGFTYDGRHGFSPIFAHLGGGWMVNAELRPGAPMALGPAPWSLFLKALTMPGRC